MHVGRGPLATFAAKAAKKGERMNEAGTRHDGQRVDLRALTDEELDSIAGGSFDFAGAIMANVDMPATKNTDWR